MPFMRIRAWYYKRVIAELTAHLTLSDNAKYAHTSLVLQAGFRRTAAHLALSDNSIYVGCIFANCASHGIMDKVTQIRQYQGL